MKVTYAVPAMLVALLAACGGGSAATGSAASGSGTSSQASTGGSVTTGGAAAPSSAGTQDQPVANVSTDVGDLAAKLHAAAVAKGSAAVALTGNGGLRASGVADFGTPMTMSMTINTSAARLRTIVLGDTMYLNLGTKLNGKDWVKISASGKDKLSTSMKPIMSMIAQQSDPGATAAAYRGVRAVSGPGPVVGGVRTIAYTYKLTTRQLAAAIPSALRSAAGSLAGTTAVETMDVGPGWLPMQVKVVTRTKTQTLSTVATYSRWGDPVTVAVPPASDVTTGLGTAAA